MKGSKNSMIFGTIAALAILAYAFYAYGESKTPGEHDEFAMCLTKNKVKFYGAHWCGHCTQQKKLFGKSFKHVDYIECALPNNGVNKECIEAGVEAYPTWVIGTEKITGGMSLEVLSEKSGCAL